MTLNNNFLEDLKIIIQNPNLADKSWVSQQYDSQVMNDTIQIGGDAAIVRVHGTQKAVAISTDCTPRYVEADAFEGAKQAVAETYRNISAVGGKPLAITNCLNFGNPQKPEIMGQIVRSIKGITEASKVLDYPVVSGNVSLYNETDGSAIYPTPAIGGVGLLKNLEQRCDTKFKNIGDEVFVIGKTKGHLSCSIYERDISKVESKSNPPQVDLALEKRHSEFVRSLIGDQKINGCHDVSDGGLLVTLFEMSSVDLGVKITEEFLSTHPDQNALLFGEDQARYVVSVKSSLVADLKNSAKDLGIEIYKIGNVIANNIEFTNQLVAVKELQDLNKQVFHQKL